MKAFPNDCWIYQWLTALFLLLLALGCVIAILTPAGIGWDFANFYDTGRRVAAGEIHNIYGSTPKRVLIFLIMFHQKLFNSYQDNLWDNPKIGCVTNS
jgi:hypothetical protein